MIVVVVIAITGYDQVMNYRKVDNMIKDRFIPCQSLLSEEAQARQPVNQLWNDTNSNNSNNSNTTDFKQKVTGNESNVLNVEHAYSSAQKYEQWVPPDNIYKQDVNSTNELYNLQELKQSKQMTVNAVSKPQPGIIYHSPRNHTNSTKRCTHYNDKYRYQMLQDAGMLNQWIMANNPEDAGRNFAHSFENTVDVESEYLQVMDDDAFTLNSQDNIEMSLSCTGLCQYVVSKLRKILADENNSTTTLLNIPFSDDTLSNDANKKFTKPCQIDENKFIPVGKCISQGKQEFNEYSTLCTSCRGIYILSKMCFPRFINALQCEKQNKKMGCIFDKITKQAHGSCHMRTLTFQVLWNRGSENCQDWSYEYIQVPSGCECHLKTMSSLLQAIKPFMS